MNKMEIIDYDKIDNLNRVSMAVNRNIGRTLDENDARGMIEGILETHAGVVLDTVAKAYIKNLATVEVMAEFMRCRG